MKKILLVCVLFIIILFAAYIFSAKAPVRNSADSMATASYSISDFIDLAANWLKSFFGLSQLPSSDVNQDSNVNSKDLGTMMRRWGTGAECPKSTVDQKTIFGVGYVAINQEVPKLYATIPVRWMKWADMKWELVEKSAPVNGKHNYDWSKVDQYVKLYQQNGMNLQFHMSVKSVWANRPLATLPDGRTIANNLAAAPPKDEAHWGYYGDFIEAFVERYDADGNNDMPGLCFPIRYYEIESESQNPLHWQGTVDEYKKLLGIAYSRAKKADPQTKIILSGINMGAIFDQTGTKSVGVKLAEAKAQFGSWFTFLESVLKEKSIYDIIEFHYNHDYTGVYGTVAWLRQFSDKPIWAGDAASGPFMFGEEMNSSLTASEILQGVVKKANPSSSWYRKEQSIMTVKKFVAGIESGLEKVIIEPTTAWITALDSPADVDKIWYIMSLVDDNLKPYPVFYSMGQIVGKIDGYASARRIANADKQIYFYEFVVGGKKVYIAWYDTAVLYGPDKTPPSKSISLPLPTANSKLKITKLITEIGKTDSAGTSYFASSNTITLSHEPIFIEVE